MMWMRCCGAGTVDHTQLVNDAPGAIMDEAKKRWEHLRKMRKRTEGA
jgi:hypothetical protein